MKIIDARSGEVMTPGKIVVYADGEKRRVINVEQRLFSARALIETTHPDYKRTSQWVPLVVRFLHPAYPFQRVAVIPS